METQLNAVRIWSRRVGLREKRHTSCLARVERENCFAVSTRSSFISCSSSLFIIKMRPRGNLCLSRVQNGWMSSIMRVFIFVWNWRITAIRNRQAHTIWIVDWGSLSISITPVSATYRSPWFDSVWLIVMNKRKWLCGESTATSARRWPFNYYSWNPIKKDLWFGFACDFENNNRPKIGTAANGFVEIEVGNGDSMIGNFARSWCEVLIIADYRFV